MQKLITGDETSGSGSGDALARADALHTALTSIVLDGGDLDKIAAEVSRALDVGVMITTSDGRQRGSAMDQERFDQLVRHDLVDPTGRVRVERSGEDGIPVGEGHVRVLRVAAGGTDLARVVCVRAEGAITVEDVHSLERAAAVAALLITKEQAVSAVENKYQGDFLRDLFLRRAGDEQYVVEHAEAFGWELDRPVVVVAAEIDTPPSGEATPSSQQRRAWQERFAAAWRQVAKDLGQGVPSVDFSSEVVTLLPVDLEADEEPTGADVVRRAVTAVAGDKGGGRRPFSVGVSRVAMTLAELPDAYGQARRAVEVGRRIAGPASTTFFDQLGIHRLIAMVPDPSELGAFARDVLGPLSEDTTEAADLRETLRVLLDTNFNVAEAARLQFFHYNTMRYRVGKLERLLGPLSTDPHLRLDTAVALRVFDVLA